nr:tape measure protein [Alcaligenes faecalis]
MTENAGTIYYTVEAETAKLISDLENANKRLEMLESGFNKTDASAKKADMQLTKTAAAVKNLGNEGAGAERKIGGLVKMLGGLIAVQGAGGLIQMAESYNEMAERVRMATSSVEEYDKVQARLLKTANGTYRALAEAQEIYIQTSDGLRSMGYSTDQALDITDSLSYSFVKNATAVDRAQSAMRAYDLALNKGKVDATGWLTVVGAIPSVVGDIAAATGKTDAEIRRMGASGEITARMLNEGLRQSLEANKKAADDMATTVRDAFTNLRTNLSVYLGEANNSTGATQALAAAISLLGDNINVVVTALSIAGAGALAKYIASMGLAAVQAGLAGVASRNAAGAALTEAKARSAAATAALAHARANIGLTTTVVQLAAAEKAAEVASKGLAAAQAAATAAGSGFLALLGGPAGLVGLVAATAIGFLTLGNNARAAVPDVDALGQSLAGLRKEELEKRLQDQGDLMRELSKKADESAAALRGLEKDYDDLGKMMQSGAVSPDELENVNKALVDQRAELAKTQRDLQTAAQTYANLAVAISNAASAQRDLNNAYNDSQSDDFLQRLKDQKAAIEDGNSAVKQAERYIKTLTNVSPERIEQIREEAKALDAARKAQERHTTGTKSANSALEDAKRGAEENGRALQRMAEQIALAHLEGEQLAVVQARLSMNQYATPEQLESAEKLAMALYQINEAQKLKTKVGDDPLAYIRGNDEPLSGGAFDEQVARYDAEEKREQERYEAKLARLRETMEAEKLTIAQYHAEFEAMQQEHNGRLKQIDDARQSVMMSTYSDGFGAVADILKNAQGEQSSAYKAMFAVSKAFAVADTAVQVYGALSKAWNSAPFPANLSAVAAATAGAIPLIAKVGAVSMGGGRQYGGPVAPGQGYRINENGAPEIFNAANGQQFMLPNTRGQVVSNKEASKGGKESAPTVTVHIHNAPPGTRVEQHEIDKQTILNVMIEDISTDGPVTKYGNAMLNWRRQGR